MDQQQIVDAVTADILKLPQFADDPTFQQSRIPLPWLVEQVVERTIALLGQQQHS